MGIGWVDIPIVCLDITGGCLDFRSPGGHFGSPGPHFWRSGGYPGGPWDLLAALGVALESPDGSGGGSGGSGGGSGGSGGGSGWIFMDFLGFPWISMDSWGEGGSTTQG